MYRIPNLLLNQIPPIGCILCMERLFTNTYISATIYSFSSIYDIRVNSFISVKKKILKTLKMFKSIYKKRQQRDLAAVLKNCWNQEKNICIILPFVVSFYPGYAVVVILHRDYITKAQEGYRVDRRRSLYGQTCRS